MHQISTVTVPRCRKKSLQDVNTETDAKATCASKRFSHETNLENPIACKAHKCSVLLFHRFDTAAGYGMRASSYIVLNVHIWSTSGQWNSPRSLESLKPTLVDVKGSRQFRKTTFYILLPGCKGRNLCSNILDGCVYTVLVLCVVSGKKNHLDGFRFIFEISGIVNQPTSYFYNFCSIG